MDMLIRIEFSLTRSIPEENKGLDLDALALKKKVGNPMKNELELCLNAENDPDQSDKWTIAVDRGHVSDTVFQVFAHMLRAYLKHRPMELKMLRMKTIVSVNWGSQKNAMIAC